MNKKLVAALSGGAALVLTLTGCSSDDDSGKKLDDWAATYCKSANASYDLSQGADKELEEANDHIKDRPRVKELYVKAFGNLANASRGLAKSLKDSGPPPVDDGQQREDAAVKELNDNAKFYDDLKAQAEKLDPGNLSKFAEQIVTLSNSLKGQGEKRSAALKKFQEGEVGKAMAKQPGCQVDKGSGSPKADDKADPKADPKAGDKADDKQEKQEKADAGQ